MKSYLKGLQAKTVTYKERKAELQAVRAEVNVLLKTKELLESRDKNIQEFTLELEKSKGVSGFQATQSQLEKVSANKSDLDKDKGSTLDETSAIVDRINQTLAAKKANLAPQIKELRAVREEYKEVEQEYRSRKTQHDNTMLALQTERARLEEDLAKLKSDLAAEESQFHFLNSLKVVHEARLQMMTDELNFQRGEGRLSDEHQTMHEKLEATIREQEVRAKKLRKRQKKIRQGFEENVAQRNMFLQLRYLMQQKYAAVQETRASTLAEQQQEQDNFMRIGQADDAVERLVFD
eukprot:TRINITY_DN64901_c0_g1_i1.p1 TRINITY_DN64901_c0_g1~~TRINITY_DN64901_c0_g1_i1.p1  ORF type:complete len:293 (+),score=168.49 TRINITY_DN64901_c0_g1_i1:67-945(+)